MDLASICDSESDDAAALLFPLIPLSRILEYVPLRSILACRASCLALAEAADGLCPLACAALLRGRMRRKNAVLLSGSWYDDGVVEEDDKLIDALLVPARASRVSDDDSDNGGDGSGKDRNPAATEIGRSARSKKRCRGGWPKKEERKSVASLTSAFDRMMRCIRVMKHVPEEAFVAFSGRYGRHLLPLGLPLEGKVDVVLYPPCARGKSCTTCVFRIPPAAKAGRHGTSDKNNDNDIDRFVQIRGRDGLIDLTRFYNVCVPNIPPDLVCPVCLSSTRSLVLGQVSYMSSSFPGGEDRHCLTYTPSHRGRVEESLGAKGENCTGSKTSPGGDETDFLFPPLYGDKSMPPFRKDLNRIRWDDSKFGISVHCVACRQFGIVVPASRCACLENKLQLPTNTMGDVIVGATFVSTRCGATGCQGPVPCWRCSGVRFRDSDCCGDDVYCEGCSSRFCMSCSTARCEEFQRYRGRSKRRRNCACGKKGRKKRKRSEKRRKKEEMSCLMSSSGRNYNSEENDDFEEEEAINAEQKGDGCQHSDDGSNAYNDSFYDDVDDEENELLVGNY